MRGIGLACGMALAACGASPPATTTPQSSSSSSPSPSSSSPPDSLADIATDAHVRDVCGDPREALLRRLVPDLFPCDSGTQLGYVVARTSAGIVLVTAGRQARIAEERTPLPFGATLVNGVVVDALPAMTPLSDLDRRALLLAAVLADTQQPRVALEAPDALALLAPEARPYLASVLAPDGDAQNASVLVVEPFGPSPDDVSTERRHVSIDADGHVTLDDPAHAEQLVHVSADGGACVPYLETLAATAGLETVSTPRLLCGDAQESAVRARMPALPSCDRIPEARYLAARTTSDPLLQAPVHPTEAIVVLWGSAPDERSVFWDHCVGTTMASTFPRGGDDLHALLEAALLLERGGTDYATSVDAIPRELPRAQRERLAAALRARREDGLVAVGWPRDHDDTMRRYRARYDESRAFRVHVYELEPTGGEHLVVDPYEDTPMGALDGL